MVRRTVSVRWESPEHTRERINEQGAQSRAAPPQHQQQPHRPGFDTRELGHLLPDRRTDPSECEAGLRLTESMVRASVRTRWSGPTGGEGLTPAMDAVRFRNAKQNGGVWKRGAPAWLHGDSRRSSMRAGCSCCEPRPGPVWHGRRKARPQRQRLHLLLSLHIAPLLHGLSALKER